MPTVAVTHIILVETSLSLPLLDGALDTLASRRYLPRYSQGASSAHWTSSNPCPSTL